MFATTNLRDIQKRTYQLTTFEDGLWDLLLGTMFLFLAVYPVTREAVGPVWNLVLFLVVLALLVVGQLTLRRIISIPRIGYAEPRRSPKLRLLLFFTVLMVLLTLGLVLVTLLSPERPPPTGLTAGEASGRGYLVELIVLLVMGGLFSIMGYLFGVRRLYFYGWMLGLANLLSVYLSHNAAWSFHAPMAIAAGIIIAIGIFRLARFLGRYPAPRDGTYGSE